MKDKFFAALALLSGSAAVFFPESAADLEITIINNDTGGQNISVTLEDCHSDLNCFFPPSLIPTGSSDKFIAYLAPGATFGSVQLAYGRFQKKCRLRVSGQVSSGEFTSASGFTAALEGYLPDVPECDDAGSPYITNYGDFRYTVTFK